MKNNYFLKTVFTFLLCGFFSMSYAADIYLSSTGLDTNDGTTALTAVASFTQAQTLAAAGDIIHVSGMIDFSVEPALVQPLGVAITKNITIQGTSNTTDGFDGKGLTRFFSNTTFSLSLKNLKLSNGFSGNNNGGAIINTSTGTLNCENVIFDGNKTQMAASAKTGAAIHFDNLNGATFKNCVFSNNEASKAGAIYFNSWAGSVLFENCAFVGNIAKESFGGSALFLRTVAAGTPTMNIVNCTFKGNHVNATANGGAINFGGRATNATTVNIINCTVTENTTAGSTGNVAGVFMNNSDANLDAAFYIKNSIVEGNTTMTGAPADLNLSAASAATPGGTTGYMAIQNSIVGFIFNNGHVSANTTESQANYLTATSNTNDLKAGLAPFNTTTNTYSLYAGSAAIGFGNSAFLTTYSTTDQLGNVRTVGATNYAGAWEAAPVATTTPSAPTALVATAGDGQISVAFKSAATGGSLITNYKYSVNDGAFVALDPAATTSPIVIAGLANNVEYTVKLIAVNANGDSPESVVSNAVTPSGTTATENAIASIRIYKNANNQLIIDNLSSENAEVSIVNTLGQQVVSRNLRASSTIQQQLSNGVYVVMLTIEGKTKSTKIIL